MEAFNVLIVRPRNILTLMKILCFGDIQNVLGQRGTP